METFWICGVSIVIFHFSLLLGLFLFVSLFSLLYWPIYKLLTHLLEEGKKRLLEYLLKYCLRWSSNDWLENVQLIVCYLCLTDQQILLMSTKLCKVVFTFVAHISKFFFPEWAIIEKPYFMKLWSICPLEVCCLYVKFPSKITKCSK